MGVSGKPSSQTRQQNTLTFLYVLYTFRIRSPHKMKDFSGKLYVPIRSVHPSQHYCELLYVPIRSVYVPYTFPT